MDPTVLRDCAWDFVAGDLDEAEAAAFTTLMLKDPAIQAEVARLRTRRASLGAPAAVLPAPDLSLAITRAAAWQRTPTRGGRRWLAAALAAGLVLGVLGMHTVTRLVPPAPSATVAWVEDGSPVMEPLNQSVRPDALLRVANSRPTRVDHALAAPAVGTPWMGVWFRPVDLDLPGVSERRGHLVVRVLGGTPADQAGIRPGDIMLYAAGCPLHTTLCLTEALRGYQPGEQVEVIYWQAATATTVSRKVPLGVRWD